MREILRLMDSPVRVYLRELLLDLANDAAAYLRTHGQPKPSGFRQRLLVAASLAACSGSAVTAGLQLSPGPAAPLSP